MPRVYNAAKLDDDMAIISVYSPIICIFGYGKLRALVHMRDTEVPRELPVEPEDFICNLASWLIILPPHHPPAVRMVEGHVDFPYADDALDYSYCYENELLEADSGTADADSG